MPQYISMCMYVCTLIAVLNLCMDCEIALRAYLHTEDSIGQMQKGKGRG